MILDFTDTASDASTTASNYTASINWGDGSSNTAGTLASDGSGGFTVTGTHTYATAQVYDPTVTISYAGRTQAITTGVNVTSLTVSSFAIGTQVQGQAYTGTVATFTDTVSVPASAYTAMINWGDGNESPGIVTAGTAGFVVTGSDVFASAGTLAPEVMITDTYGATAICTDSVTVEGIAITPETISVNAGTAFTGTVATFTSNTSGASSHSYSGYIDFGDGNWVAGTVTSIGSNTYAITGTATLSVSGNYQPTIDVLDDTSGNSDSLPGTPDQPSLPAPSTPLYSVDASGTAVTLSWSYSNTASLTSIEIEEEVVGDATDSTVVPGNFYVIQTLSPTATSSPVTSLNPGEDYAFMIRALALGESSESSPVDVTLPMAGAPNAPVLSVTAPGSLPGNYTLTWTESSSLSSVDHYVIEYQETDQTALAASDWQYLDTVAGGSGSPMSYTLGPDEDSVDGPLPGELGVGQMFNVRVIAAGNNGHTENSAPSNAEQATEVIGGSEPAAPQDFQGTWASGADSSGGTIDLSWNYNTDDGTPNETWTFVQNGIAKTGLMLDSGETWTSEGDGNYSITATVTDGVGSSAGDAQKDAHLTGQGGQSPSLAVTAVSGAGSSGGTVESGDCHYLATSVTLGHESSHNWGTRIRTLSNPSNLPVKPKKLAKDAQKVISTDDRLAEIVSSWERVPQAVREALVTMVRASTLPRC